MKGKRRRLPGSQGAQILPILKFDEFEFRQKGQPHIGFDAATHDRFEKFTLRVIPNLFRDPTGREPCMWGAEINSA